MFNLVPSNRQEFLLQVLIAYINDDYQKGTLDLFEPSIVMVESQGMKHYVNMGIAKQCHVSMNIDFPLVTRGIYNLCRQILGEDKVPKESPYKREVMVWRIEQMLRSQVFIDNEDATFANEYWQQANDSDKARFMLAHHTADVFEQYMQFRPHWFEKWQENKSVFDEPSHASSLILEPWQRLLWQNLVNEDTWYPAKIIEEATKKFQVDKFDLPKVIYIFVVNAFTPEQLKFLVEISKQVDIYLFHLNPCVEYWGDLISEKAQVKLQLKQKLSQGLEGFADEESANSLLANLGKQGRTLFNQLREIDYLDYTDGGLFEMPVANSESITPSLLRAIQQDLINANQGEAELIELDNSVSVHNCHSHLREIQVLHDYLLHIINNDETQSIQPHDIIVLCPAVEEYAPYVKGVFRGPYDEDTSDDPKLVCSIADRAPLDADPTVAMFMDMLALPDSRFSSTSIIDYLQIDSVQNKFELSKSEVEICEKWISDANIYWGKDAAHKAATLKLDEANDTYTWQWGLSRLLKSALYSQQQHEELDFGLLDSVEGLSLQTLGKLVLFIDTLQTIYTELAKPRHMFDWLAYMRTDIIESLFESKQTAYSINALLNAIEQISANLMKAEYDQIVSLSVAREALSNILSKPDPLNQFNTGQVTFCSMVPMRSVPFKVVCILGLNDGVFPRVTQPLSIDLIPLDNPLVTDRSRRNEDRYMFLEAVVSARDYLYLSYQGRSIKNNSPREPSLVLREFCDYVKKVFKQDIINLHPLQPFSSKAFKQENIEHRLYAQRPSYCSPYLKIAQNEISPLDEQNGEPFDIDFVLPHNLSVRTLTQFFDDPLAAFSKHHLQVSFDSFSDVQSDVEPFAVSGLTKYQINTSMLGALAQSQQQVFYSTLSELEKAGDLPEIASRNQIFTRIYEQLAESIDVSAYSHTHSHQEFVTTIKTESTNVQIFSDMAVLDDCGENTCQFLPQIVKEKALFEFCINHAVKCLSLNKTVRSEVAYFDIKTYSKELLKYFKGTNDEPPEVNLETLIFDETNFSLEKAEQFLQEVVTIYCKGMRKPALLHISLGATLNKSLAKMEDVAHTQGDFLPLADSHITSKNQNKGALFNDQGIDIELKNGLVDAINNSYMWNEYANYFYLDGIDGQQIDLIDLYRVFSKHLPKEWGI